MALTEPRQIKRIRTIDCMTGRNKVAVICVQTQRTTKILASVAGRREGERGQRREKDVM